MKHLIINLAFLSVMAFNIPNVLAEDDNLSSKEAMNVMDQFLEACNDRDIEAWSKTLNYPHVRFASGQVKVWEIVRLSSPKPIYNL